MLARFGVIIYNKPIDDNLSLNSNSFVLATCLISILLQVIIIAKFEDFLLICFLVTLVTATSVVIEDHCKWSIDRQRLNGQSQYKLLLLFWLNRGLLFIALLIFIFTNIIPLH